MSTNTSEDEPGELIDNKSKHNAKEHCHMTKVYSHECRVCGDPSDDYTVSVIGQVLECVCGNTYKVVK